MRASAASSSCRPRRSCSPRRAGAPATRTAPTRPPTWRSRRRREHGSNHHLLQALADFPAVVARRLDAEAGADSRWHELGRALMARGVAIDLRARATIRLAEFGAARIEVDGREVRPRIAKSVALLAYLAAAPGHAAERDGCWTRCSAGARTSRRAPICARRCTGCARCCPRASARPRRRRRCASTPSRPAQRVRRADARCSRGGAAAGRGAARRAARRARDRRARRVPPRDPRAVGGRAARAARRARRRGARGGGAPGVRRRPLPAGRGARRGGPRGGSVPRERVAAGHAHRGGDGRRGPRDRRVPPLPRASARWAPSRRRPPSSCSSRCGAEFRAR